MKPIKRLGERPYILKADRDLDPSEQTVFTLGALSLEERLILTLGGNGTKHRTQLAWDLGVKEMVNFESELVRDEEKPFISNTQKKPWKSECFDNIDENDFFEVSMEVINSMNLTEDETKN